MNKKGFTLVELLAVIAILAILVIIALPNVLQMFNNAKKSAFKTEVLTVYKQAGTDFISDNLRTSGPKYYCDTPQGIGDGSSPADCKNLNLTTTKKYYVEMDSTGKVTYIGVQDNSFVFGKSNVSSVNDIDVEEVLDASKHSDFDIYTKYETEGESAEIIDDTEGVGEGTGSSSQTNNSASPSCSLKINASNVSFNTKTDDVAVVQFGLTTSSTPTYNGNSSLATGVGTYYGYVKDADGNTGICSIQVTNTTVRTYYNCKKAPDACNCAACVNYANGCWQRISVQENGTCPSGYIPYGSAYCQKHVSSYNSCGGGGWTYSGDSCHKYNQISCPNGTTAIVSQTTYLCSNGYTKLNNTYCYK